MGIFRPICHPPPCRIAAIGCKLLEMISSPGVLSGCVERAGNTIAEQGGTEREDEAGKGQFRRNRTSEWNGGAARLRTSISAGASLD
jgi:hypothetical protein